ncbi:integrase [Mesorhizobium sp. B2-3-14]|uniref:tyrosine-type recombinase/integrase n=1 Tax=Mesorhizobium sp. B2-3-14 TaxID=2589950 RepID=UPI001129419C|nr:tyrosine-type recombinase/integrase [Mesorhizobium sp. B2-3-14]TPL86804.1 integrase [Mesorhizobium sp. B2-3-14]
MAKVLKEAELTTAKARSRLPVGEHARRLDAEAHLYYRKGIRAGVWFVRWRNWGAGANYKQAPIGAANDTNDKPSEGLLTFLQAERAAREHVEKARVDAKAAAEGPTVTVRMAVEVYVARRDAREKGRSGREGRSDANRRLSRHVLGQDKRGKQAAIPASPLAGVALHALKDRDLTSWRDGLPADMKATTVRRLANDLRAALNAAYVANRARLPATVPGTIKHSLAAPSGHDEPDGDDAGARESQILSDADVTRLLRAAREIDRTEGWEGDLFRLIVLLAATGARFSQVVRMKVGDVQRAYGRVMVPVSRKGRGSKSGAAPVPVGSDVLDALLPASTGRPNDAPLLERWRHKQVGPAKWERTGRGPWLNVADLRRPWIALTAKAGLTGVIPYALRHSSIVRGIRANLPIRLVAAVHDTSVQMIERHYAKWIASGLEDMVAKAVVPLVSDEGGNIVLLARRP